MKSKQKHTPGLWTIGEDGDVFCEGACIAKVCGAPDGKQQDIESGIAL